MNTNDAIKQLDSRRVEAPAIMDEREEASSFGMWKPLLRLTLERIYGRNRSIVEDGVTHGRT